MVDTSKIEKIKTVIEEFFAQNKELTIIPVKKLMPAFIDAGIFAKDIRKGFPIRKILKELDSNDQLDLIPFVHVDRSGRDVYWYFKPLDAPAPETPYKQSIVTKDESSTTSEQYKNDEAYVISLCDKVLGQKAYRQKKFDFLVGDIHKDGKKFTELPIDAYYDSLQLAIEFRIKEHAESTSKSKRQEKETVSGMSRREQRIRYDLRKEKVLTEKGIAVIIISNSNFSCDDRGKVNRNEESDLKIITKLLSRFIQ